jgi:hypothetical protein|uniref:Uncharacterized protein n=1 Tax=Podoviridae sp. ctBev14 TaxID=2823556 RepID=A0A8S5LAN5_9CAUD|nr:MAG TPA: hypothetical protein [Podoviridae sp. ctBev14]
MKYIIIDSLGKRRLVFDEEAAQKAMDEGKIVINDKFNILNPIILTPECDGKFAVIKENEPAKFIKYHAGCELDYEIDGNLYDPFGHARLLPTERTTISPDYRVKYVISERGTNYFSKHVVVNLKAYNKLRDNMFKLAFRKIYEKTNFKVTT